ncbi:MAG: SAM-dependent methyltransferase [Sphingomonas sp.]|nr:SAM-dependent methyltransferase [Sphingomonas sp.]
MLTRKANDWSDKVGAVWAEQWRRTDRAFGSLSQKLNTAIADAAPQGGFRAFDIGCGAGATSFALAEARPEAEIIGVDLSPDLLSVAAQRSRHPAIRFVEGDAGEVACRETPIDLFVSRHGVMFFSDPVATFARFADVSVPDAAMVFSCFAEIAANPWVEIATDGVAPPPFGSPGPFAFADPDYVGDMLAQAGWRGEVERCDFDYIVGEGDKPVEDAMAFLTRIGPAAAMLRDADGAQHMALLTRMRDILSRNAELGRIAFPASAWIWRARREAA